MKKKTRLKIERIGNDGEGIAYINKRPVFIDYALLDEVVDVDIEKNSRGNFEGKNIDVIKQSPLRIDPPCPYYFRCGGCNMQHTSYFEQIKHKRNVINFLYNVNLRKETRKTKLNLTITSPIELRYRNKVTLPVQEINEKLEVGFYYKDSNRFLPVKSCLVHKMNLDLLTRNILDLLEKHEIKAFDNRTKRGDLRYIIARTNQLGDLQVTFVLAKPKNIETFISELVKDNPKIKSVFTTINSDTRSREFFGSKTTLMYGDLYLEETIGDYKLLLGPESFFQLNAIQAKNMYDEMIRLAKFNKNDIVLDAYAGVASIGIYISNLVKEVYSIEINKEACEAAKESLKLNEISNVKVFEGDTLEVFKTLDIKPNVMIFNPPRTGLGSNLSEFILSKEPDKIIYGSCNPKTLVDDLKILSKKYNIVDTTPLDMFPQTSHIESVTLLEKKR